ncbi:peptidase S10 [Paucibacter sp. APW11]|uniref:Peptidase S10 n=1 Tax=Roseateles aquae TaxID=3077235 RepID=A0ABU3PDD2_9BURK|nr:peptidase S10 [Paucibacter sp. APW11]MDT9000608.1 peptidase S10 [Paucibacter sp. APW11]
MRPYTIPLRLALALLSSALLSSCGGGSSGGSTSTTPPPTDAGVLQDSTVYSMAATASLPSAQDSAVQTTHSLSLSDGKLDYQAEAGHLLVKDPQSSAAEASVFYVAYQRLGVASASRPLIFFYNGGPGSASVWLHLGAYGPKRLVTNFPAANVPQPYQLVDNQETLLREADLVFVDAVGTGYSEAVAPNTNASFWGVDSDAKLFRDFVLRYIEAKQRKNSPLLVFGESYGGFRSPLLAAGLLAAGAPLQGVVLQSAILNYNSNCAVITQRISCSAFLPSYAATAAWFKRSTPPSTDIPGFAQQALGFASSQFEPAVQQYLSLGTVLNPALAQQLASYSGLSANSWQANPLLGPTALRTQLLPQQLLGRYDSRVSAGVNDVLSGEGDPSSTAITPAFRSAIADHLRLTLKYQASSAYTLGNDAVIQQWDWRHDGHALPDAIPDLALAFALKPALKLLVVGGYHDLATPFWLTEQDLARLGAAPPGLKLSRHIGGHMTYLDDQVRPALKADLSQFITSLSAP